MLKYIGLIIVIAALMAGGVYLLSSGAIPSVSEPEPRVATTPAAPAPRASTPVTPGVSSAPAAADAAKAGGFVLPVVTPQEAYRRWRDDPAHTILLDVRTQEEYDKWNIPGAIHVPVADEDFGRRVENKIRNKDIDIFVFCRTGRRSEPAAAILHGLGYKKLHNMGGIIDWPYETSGSDG